MFVLIERRAAEPVLPLWVLRRRLLVTTSLVAACVGAVLLGLTSYVPTFVQDVLGTGPLVAGFALAALTLGWPLARRGRAGCTCGSASGPPRSSAAPSRPRRGPAAAARHLLERLQVGATSFVVGVGMGFSPRRR